MKYEYTCNYETSLEYLPTVIIPSKKGQEEFLSKYKEKGYLSGDAKKTFETVAEEGFALGVLQVWFNPLVVDLAKELLSNGKVEKGYEIKETLELLHVIP